MLNLYFIVNFLFKKGAQLSYVFSRFFVPCENSPIMSDQKNKLTNSNYKNANFSSVLTVQLQKMIFDFLIFLMGSAQSRCECDVCTILCPTCKTRKEKVQRKGEEMRAVFDIIFTFHIQLNK